jgi:AcrR family transcriptional regulator
MSPPAVVGERPAFNRLTPGPGRSPSEVSRDQRHRIQNAMTDLVVRTGYSGVTMRQLSALAKVSTRSVYRQFDGKDDCLLSAYAMSMETVCSRLERCRAAGRDEQLGTIVRELVDALVGEHFEGRLTLIEVFDGGPAATTYVESWETSLSETLARVLARGDQKPSLLQSRWIAAAVIRVARSAIIARTRPSPEECELLTRWVDAVLHADRIPSRAQGTPAWQTKNDFACQNPPPAHTPDREKILSAVVRASLSKGYWGLSLGRIQEFTDISKRHFGTYFADLDESYLAATEGLAWKFMDGNQARSGSRDWHETIRRQVKYTCASIDRGVPEAKLAFVGILSPGVVGVLRREKVIGDLADRWRNGVLAGSPPTHVETAETTIAALWTTFASLLSRHPRNPMAAEASSLASLAALFSCDT